MKRILILFSAAIFISSVLGEQCKTTADCQQTECHVEHGWWLHCQSNTCICTHDTYAGKPCADGSVDTCHAVHGNRCANMGLVWHCIDEVCHCSKL